MVHQDLQSPQAMSARNSIGPDTCWQQTSPRGTHGRSLRIARVGRETDPPWLRGQALTTLVASALDHSPAGASAHPGSKAVSLLALTLVRLVRPLHYSSLAARASRDPSYGETTSPRKSDDSHKGRRSIQVRPSVVNLQIWRPRLRRFPDQDQAGHAASVNRLLGTLWKNTEGLHPR